MPHINIKHVPLPLTTERELELVAAVSSAVAHAFDIDEGAVSVALEPVPREAWHERVYQPEILHRKELLRKSPNY
jgi:phenylpyruvate tautomerase PptA (4-oxalocrotonate tautomerase family)